MNFINLYPEYHRRSINCNIKSQFRIKYIFVGSGGSVNIVLKVQDKYGTMLIIKIIPDLVYINVKTKPNYHLLAIKFYQFFTKKYLLTDRTLHIVGIYNHQICNKFGKLLANIKPKHSGCSSLEEKLTKPPKYDPVNEHICSLLEKYRMKLVEPYYNIVLLEHCTTDFGELIEWHMNDIKKSKHKNISIKYFIQTLQRILFQIIFTLAIIKDDYPGFMHGDFFVRNILISYENNFNQNDYLAYHYKQKIFYLPANGPYAKINDFDFTIIANELEPNTYQLEKKLLKLNRVNPFNPKTDIYNLLHDMYDGQKLGSTSINYLAQILNIPAKTMKPIRQFLKKFINVSVIDKINRFNRYLLNSIWNIDRVKILEDTVLVPQEYLYRDHFRIYQNLPKDGNIVWHLNRPK